MFTHKSIPEVKSSRGWHNRATFLPTTHSTLGSILGLSSHPLLAFVPHNSSIRRPGTIFTAEAPVKANAEYEARGLAWGRGHPMGWEGGGQLYLPLTTVSSSVTRVGVRVWVSWSWASQQHLRLSGAWPPGVVRKRPVHVRWRVDEVPLPRPVPRERHQQSGIVEFIACGVFLPGKKNLVFFWLKKNPVFWLRPGSPPGKKSALAPARCEGRSSFYAAKRALCYIQIFWFGK